MCKATCLDAALVCGSDQLCAGLQVGSEGAIHGMNELFSTHQEQYSEWGVLLVDAANAFNSLRIMLPCCCILVFFGLDVLIFFLIPTGNGQC